jgi:hypothetical protein
MELAFLAIFLASAASIGATATLFWAIAVMVRISKLEARIKALEARPDVSTVGQ